MQSLLENVLRKFTVHRIGKKIDHKFLKKNIYDSQENMINRTN